MMAHDGFPDMVFVDLETTGATATVDRITEVGVVSITSRGIERYSQLVNPETRIPEFIQGLTGITDAMVQNAPTFSEIAQDLWDRLHGLLFVAHNARFTTDLLKTSSSALGSIFVHACCARSSSRGSSTLRSRVTISMPSLPVMGFTRMGVIVRWRTRT